MKLKIASLALLCLVACKRTPTPQMTVPDLPDAVGMPAQQTVETPNAYLVNRALRYSGQTGQALGFYKEFALKMGAHRGPDSWVDDNLSHAGGMGRDGYGSVKDDTKPGIYIAVAETVGGVIVDIWELVPKTR